MEQLGSIDHSKDFASSVEEIINQPLTVENVDTYAEAALDKLIQLINEMVQAYEHQLTIWPDNSAEREDAAFAYYGVEKIGELLDHIAAKAEQLIAIDTAIGQIESIGDVFVPPDDRPGPTASVSEAPHREWITHQPRLKILLFILANEFGIEPSSEALQIRRGSVETMMRQEPYHEVTIPSLERTVLICDAYGNGTFVFDTTRLPEEERAKLTAYTKTQLMEGMAQYPGCGAMVRCDDYFVPHLVGALADDLRQPVEMGRQRQGNYLSPRRMIEAMGGLTINGLADKLGVKYRVVATIAAQLERDGFLGEVAKRDWCGKQKPVFTREQAELIEESLKQKGMFNLPPPEGYLTIKALANVLGVSDMTISKIVRSLKEDGILSEGAWHRSPQVREFFSPEQQAVIKEKARDRGLFAPPPPEGCIMVGAAMKRFGVCRKTIKNAMHSLGLQSSTYRFSCQKGRVKICEGLLREQVEAISDYFLKRGYMRPAPEDYLATSDLMNALHCGSPAFQKAIKVLNKVDPDFGEPLACRGRGSNGVNSSIGYFYSPEQQAKIAAMLEDIRQGAAR